MRGIHQLLGNKVNIKKLDKKYENLSREKCKLERILVAEDNVVLRKLARLNLQRLMYIL